MLDLLTMSFFQHALVAAVLASVACGSIGSLIVVNRQVFLAGGVAHAAYGGVGLAFYLGLPVLPCTLGFTSLAGLTIAQLTFEKQERADSYIGVLWATGMAFGIILIALTPGYNVDLMSYLFGSILTVPSADLWAMAALDAVIVGIMAFYYNDLLSLSFDMEFARANGIRTHSLYSLTLVLIAIAVVMVIQVVGLILVIALLTIPPMLAEKGATSLLAMSLRATAYCLSFCLAGIAISYWFDLPSGASIIAVGAATFIPLRLVPAGLRALSARHR